MRLRRLRVAAVLLPLVVLVTACLFRPRVDPSRYFTLAPSTTTAPAERGGIRIGLGPVTMPGYLDRPSLATRVDATRVRYAEWNRWAEPLPTQFVRVFGEDLGRCVGTAQITPFPWYPATPIDVVVRIEVLAFETDTTGTARLDAVWSVRDPTTDAARRSGHATITEPVEGTTAGEGDDPPGDAAVAALSRALERLACDIAPAVRSR